ncbi:FtsX-like permease family protein [Lentimicrobium sp.]|uniref:ABC transporter permease n=1 Tax=Lentimicrobium sp. TaxID=2034841 RepID=UPI002B5D9169|nr:FtsX-like permease family protein [Lentimicrobium sp.]HPR27423.1 FtsX-like permease family protein [Lentimicrobium sp.]
MMIWSIAWKNLWRNRKRSLVVIVAVTIGIISGVLLVGIMEGWINQRLHDAIYNEVSHVQIHNKEYLKNEEIDLTIKNYDQLTNGIDSLKELAGRVNRTRIFAMANTPWANTGVIIYGVDPEKERQVTEIYKKIVPGGGRYPDKQSPADILISDKTAGLLKLKQYIITDSVIAKLKEERIRADILAKLEKHKDKRFRSPGDFREMLKQEFNKRELDKAGRLITEYALDYRLRNKIQVTFSDLRGTPVQGIFRVCGIYKTTNTGFDQTAVFVNAGELAKLYGGGEILNHEISILLKNIDDAGVVRDKLSRIADGNAVMTWKELAPDAALMHDFMIIYYFIFIGIIMLALAFGIINTMLMSILERTKELGMLMAIGMNRRRIFQMIMLETVFLTLVGAVAGMFSGWIITEILGKTGIHFSGWGEGFEAMGFAAKVYPVVSFGFFVFVTAMVVATAIISSLWPARKALRLNPLEALRTD